MLILIVIIIIIIVMYMYDIIWFSKDEHKIEKQTQTKEGETVLHLKMETSF